LSDDLSSLGLFGFDFKAFLLRTNEQWGAMGTCLFYDSLLIAATKLPHDKVIIKVDKKLVKL
jgi:hypothetical protein